MRGRRRYVRSVSRERRRGRGVEGGVESRREKWIAAGMLRMGYSMQVLVKYTSFSLSLHKVSLSPYKRSSGMGGVGSRDSSFPLEYN